MTNSFCRPSTNSVSDVQTDVHIVPVDSDAPNQQPIESTNSEMCIGAAWGQSVRPRAPLSLFYITYLTDL